MVQTSRGRTASLHRAPAGFTALALDGYGLRDLMLTRPANSASYPVPVRRVATLLHASFRPRLATTPLRFANPSPPSGWVEDFHLQADVHARHTTKRPCCISRVSAISYCTRGVARRRLAGLPTGQSRVDGRLHRQSESNGESS